MVLVLMVPDGNAWQVIIQARFGVLFQDAALWLDIPEHLHAFDLATFPEAAHLLLGLLRLLLACPPKFVSNHAPQGGFQRLLPLVHEAAQSFIDERLVVPAPRVVDLLPKPSQNVVVQSDRYPGNGPTGQRRSG